MRDGKAKVLSDAKIARLPRIVKAERHAERNLALVFLSFGLGLRVGEIASLNVEDVLDQEAEIALVVLDLAMPRVGGREVVSVLRAGHPHVRILVSTGYASAPADIGFIRGHDLPVRPLAESRPAALPGGIPAFLQ